jgi:hypothetical protein
MTVEGARQSVDKYQAWFMRMNPDTLKILFSKDATKRNPRVSPVRKDQRILEPSG